MAGSYLKTEAIVLHAIKYGESRLIIDVFARETGRLSLIATMPKTQKGWLKKQYFQPMTLLEIEYEQRQRVQLQRLKDARLLAPYASIPFSPEKLALSLFVAEFLYHALRSEQQDEPLFAYISGAMQWLDMAPGGYANFHLTFLMRMSKFLGFFPNLEEDPTPSLQGNQSPLPWGGDGGRLPLFDLREGRFCSEVPMHRDFLQPDDAQRIRTLMRMDFPTMHVFQLNRNDRNRIVDVLLHYYRLHIPQFPELKSLTVLQELFA